MQFVVHEHSSSHHHYDFRLEIGGVLKSWAIPKGPSLNPADKRLAIAVPDHSMDYASYEGVIPEGEYGAGPVVIWDRGTYATDKEEDLLSQWKKGRIEFTLRGRKLKGAFTLVRFRGRENQWLLIKSRDKYADPSFRIRSLLTPVRTKALHVKRPPPHEAA